MPNHLPTAQPGEPKVPKMGPRIWLWLVVGLMSFGYLLAWLTPLAVRFPAASVPAILGAAFGFLRSRRGGRGEAHPNLREGQMRIQTHTLVWGIVSGAIGYACLAALGIGVPAPEAALVWRVFGGAVFGAAAGVAAGAIVPLVALIPSLVALVAARRRLRRAA